MNPQTKIQRFLNPSQSRSMGGLNTLTRENFARIMMESLSKAINTNESPVKEKHVRKLLIGSFQAESGGFFWQYLKVMRSKLFENQFACWKFCHVLHKMLRDGHKGVLQSSYEQKQTLLDYGNMWRHMKDGYGPMIFKYCTLLYNRINFLTRNSGFPNDLKVSDDELDEIGERNVSVFFDLSCEIFDALDDILRLQELVLMTLDLKKLNSMSNSGQCHLAPLVACIQDSSLFYDYSVKILFKLHSSLEASTLEGHRNRFLCQHTALKNFYVNTSNLQYFKTLIQIPHLTDQPPNFLIASDIQQHVTPKVVMIANIERESPDQLSSIEPNSQLLVNIGEDMKQDDLESIVSQSVTCTTTSNDNSIDAILNHGETFQDSSVNLELRNKNDELINKVRELELVVENLKAELEEEKFSHMRTKESSENNIVQINTKHEEELKLRQIEVTKVKDELRSLKYQMTTSQNLLNKVQDDCKRAQHDSEISEGVMKKLVKDMSDLKTENANLRQHLPVQTETKESNGLVEGLNNKIRSLEQELKERNLKLRELLLEKETLESSKISLEKQLDNHQEDLLLANMNETDKIISEATKRIEELSENSRKHETGIKLQVNEKISEVCSNLMQAVRNLIIQSRLLQREVVGGDGKTNSADFYKRNSSWTEGLISAANVVAMAARSLVDSADRTMSGQARFSELAAAAHEVAAATTQLLVASRVKANKDSEKLKILTSVSKQVNQCTSIVVDTARVCAQLIEQEIDKVDISSLSLHQTKKLEMETQVRLLELEDQLSKERLKLGFLRRQHYEQEDAQAVESTTK